MPQLYSFIDNTVGAGATTLAGMGTAGAVEYGIGISSDIVCRNLQCTGISTISASGDDISTRHLNVTGVSTFVGIVTFQDAVYLGPGIGGTIGSNAVGTRTISTSDPTGGANGDIWFKY